MLAVGISEDGQREILGLEMAFGETEQGWRRFIRQLKERGLSGVELATSDAHERLKQALQECFPGLIWQRCQSHFRRNVLDQTPSGCRDEMHEVLDQVLEASTQEEAIGHLDEHREQLEEEVPSAFRALEDGFCDATTVLALPEKYRKRLLWANMLERFSRKLSGPTAGKGDLDLPKHGVSLPAHRRPLRGDPRRVVHRSPMPEHGRILRMES
jgi:transposase-like protein